MRAMFVMAYHLSSSKTKCGPPPCDTSADNHWNQTVQERLEVLWSARRRTGLRKSAGRNQLRHWPRMFSLRRNSDFGCERQRRTHDSVQRCRQKNV